MLRRRGTTLIDLVLCAVLLGVSVPPTLDGSPGGPGGTTAWDTVLLPVFVVPILLRRRRPLVATAAFAGAAVLSGAPTFEQFRIAVAIPTAMLVVFSVARGSAVRAAVGGLLFVLTGMVFVVFTETVLDDDGARLGTTIFSTALCCGMYGAGRVARTRDRLVAQLADRSARLRARRKQTAALAVEIEQARLAAELDGALRARLPAIVELAAQRGRDAAESRALYGGIERAGRSALNEMREVLGVLRSDERAAHAPMPTLRQLDELIADARSDGRDVELEVLGERPELSMSVELAVYRLLQHGLAAVRNSAREPVRIRLRYDAQTVTIDIEGPVTDSADVQTALLAAHERALAHGASFAVGQPERGRQRLCAALPTLAIDG